MDRRSGRIGAARSRVIALGLAVAMVMIGCTLVDSLLPGVLVKRTPTATPTATFTVTPTFTSTCTPSPTPTITPLPTPEPLRLLVQFDPSPAYQGDTVLINLSANRRFRVTGSLGGRSLHFVLRGEGGVAEAAWAVVGIDATEPPGDLSLQLAVVDDLGRESTVSVDLTVVAAAFGSETISVPPDRQGLLDSAVSAEEAKLVHDLYLGFTPERLWDGRFQWPHLGKVTSSFAMSRVYNDGRRNGYHGGVDISGDVGMPVSASASGKVVLATELQVRGGTIVLDHGLGVYTAYYHLAVIQVTEGQVINRGDIIGQVGNTGLSTGAHLHWEMSVGGVLVDPREWAARDIPGSGIRQ